MTDRISQATDAHGTTERRGRTRRARLLIAGTALGIVATAAMAGGAMAAPGNAATTAAACAAASPPPPMCAAPAPMPAWRFPTTPVPGSGPSWFTRPPVTTPPVPVPPVPSTPMTLPPVSLPPVTVPPLPLVPVSLPDAARRLLELVNLERQEAGLGRLVARDDVGAIALDHSTRMALEGDIFHNVRYFSPATRRRLGAAVRGENVAYNGSVENAHARLMNSPGHRANLLNRRFSVVGIAVVQAPDGRYFITEDFLQPAGRKARPVSSSPAKLAAATRRSPSK